MRFGFCTQIHITIDVCIDIYVCLYIHYVCHYTHNACVCVCLSVCVCVCVCVWERERDLGAKIAHIFIKIKYWCMYVYVCLSLSLFLSLSLCLSICVCLYVCVSLCVYTLVVIRSARKKNSFPFWCREKTTGTAVLVRGRGGGLGSRPIFKKFNEPYAPS